MVWKLDHRHDIGPVEEAETAGLTMEASRLRNAELSMRRYTKKGKFFITWNHTPESMSFGHESAPARGCVPPILMEAVRHSQWIRLADVIRLDALQDEDRSQVLNGHRKHKTALMGASQAVWHDLGALIFKERLQVTDDEVVDQIE